jgi:hypothetical protein
MLRLSADTLGPRNPYWREWGRQALAHFEASGNRVRAAELNALLESLDPAVKE